jgi:hypothetical protein
MKEDMEVTLEEVPELGVVHPRADITPAVGERPAPLILGSLVSVYSVR